MVLQSHDDLERPRLTMSRRRALPSLVGGALVLAGLAGCGGGDDEDEGEGEGEEDEQEEQDQEQSEEEDD